MLPFCSLDEDYKDYFGESFHPGRKDIHVLVELPSVEPMMRATGMWWLATGLVENALRTREVRSRSYRLADAKLGYYDPANVPSDNKVQAFWYTNNDLQIHVLFKKEEHALHFQSGLTDEFITIRITSFISEAPCPRSQKRIFGADYDAQESQSPRGTVSSVLTDVCAIDPDNPFFKYQRIEAERLFGPNGKGESARLMASAFCRREREYAQCGRDDNY